MPDGIIGDLAKWTNDIIGVPIHDAVHEAAAWTGEHIGDPIHDGVHDAAKWTDEHVGEGIRSAADAIEDLATPDDAPKPAGV